MPSADGGVVDNACAGTSTPGFGTSCCNTIPADAGCVPGPNAAATLCRPSSADLPGILSAFLSLDTSATIDPSQSNITIILSDGGIAASPSVTGEVDLLGHPCPGGSCGVAASFTAFPGDFSAQGTDFSDLMLAGHSLPGALVPLAPGDGQLTGQLGSNNFTITATGTASQSVLFGIANVGGTQALQITPMNAPALDFMVDYVGHTFTISSDMPFMFPGDSSQGIPAFSAVLKLAGTIVNEPPTAVVLPTSQTVECDSPTGAAVTLDGTQSSDLDGNLDAYTWWQGSALFGTSVGTNATLQTQAPFNGSSATSTTYALEVADAFWQVDVAQAQVTVVDNNPPVIDSIQVAPNCLWPPNHEMVLFRLGQELLVHAHDTCDAAPTVSIKSVEDSQPFLGGGSGNTTPDFVFGEGAMCLRAERDGTRNAPRVYTVTIAVVDHAGNEADGTVQISVPHDEGQGFCPGVPAANTVADEDPACTAGLPASAPVATPSASPPSHPAPAHGKSVDRGCQTGGGAPGLIMLLATGAMLWMRRSRRLSWKQ